MAVEVASALAGGEAALERLRTRNKYVRTKTYSTDSRESRESRDTQNEDDDSWTPSMLDLTKLCATSDERSPTSVLLPGDLAPFDDRVHPNIPAR